MRCYGNTEWRRYDGDASPEEGIKTFFRVETIERIYATRINDEMEEMKDDGYGNMQVGKQNC